MKDNIGLQTRQLNQQPFFRRTRENDQYLLNEQTSLPSSITRRITYVITCVQLKVVTGQCTSDVRRLSVDIAKSQRLRRIPSEIARV